MKENLEKSLVWVLAHEGGWSNHPKDPGGATMRGVTQRVYDAYRKRKGLMQQTVRLIAPEEILDIYKHQYWDAVRADELPGGLDYAVFDYAVNSGPQHAAKDLQRVLGVTLIDGVVGEVTLAAANKGDVFQIVEALCQRRMKFLRGLKTWGTFGKGWTNRVMGHRDGSQTDDVGVIDRAVALVMNHPVPAASQPAPGKGQEEARTNITQSHTVQAVAAQLGTALPAMGGAWAALEGVERLVAMGFIGATILFALWIGRERIRKWVEGDR